MQSKRTHMKLLTVLVLVFAATTLAGCDADMSEDTTTFDPWTTRMVSTRVSVSTGR